MGEAGGDRLLGGQGEDVLVGETGDDVLVGRAGADTFFFDPSRPDEGDDLVADFTPARTRVPVPGRLSASSDLVFGLFLAPDQDVTEAPVLAALDASAGWALGSADGDLLVVHPNGSIRFSGIDAGAATSFLDVAGAVEIEGLA